eukprot:4510743-Pyramimonas_sp.AAC.2
MGWRPGGPKRHPRRSPKRPTWDIQGAPTGSLRHPRRPQTPLGPPGGAPDAVGRPQHSFRGDSERHPDAHGSSARPLHPPPDQQYLPSGSRLGGPSTPQGAPQRP